MEIFKLTTSHIDLLSRFYVCFNDNCEFGAPEIDPKRPYGNSNVFIDIAEIVNVDYPDEDEYENSEDYNSDLDKIESYLLAFHLETETALQIVLCCKTFQPGYYVKENIYSDLSWRPATEEEIAFYEDTEKNKRFKRDILNLQQLIEEKEAELADLKNKVNEMSQKW